MAIDPQFAMAHLWLAVNSWNFGRMKESRANIQKAYDLRMRVSERERLLIEAEYYHYSSEKTWDKAIDAYSRLLNLYPFDLFGRGELAFLYWRMEEWDKAIDLYEVLRRNKDENTGTHQMLAWSYLAKNQPDKAREVLEDYLNTIADSSFLRANVGLVYCILGNMEKAKQEIDKAYAQWGDDKWYKFIYLVWADDLTALETLLKQMETSPEALIYIGAHSAYLARQGKIKEARSVYSHELEKMRGAADPGEQSFWIARFALFLEKTVDFSGALSASDMGLKLAREVGDGGSECQNLYRRGVVQARQGNFEEARRSAEELRLAIGNWQVKKRIRLYDGLLALIALQQKDITSAHDHLQKALLLAGFEAGGENRLEFLDYLAEAYEQTGRWAEAKRVYKEILSFRFLPCYSPGSMLISVRGYYKLGNVLEHLDNKAGAAAKYRKFLDLWKNADPGLPEVDDAKKRLAGLQSY